MRTTEIDDDELDAILERDESHFFDFKDSSVSGKSVQKIAVAFSNADGGEFIIGIRDKKDANGRDRWEGIASIEDMNGYLQAVFEISPALDVRYEFLKRRQAKGYALRVLVEKGSQVSTTSAKNVFVRQGAQSLPITDLSRIQQLSYAKGASSFEDTKLPELPPESIVDSDELRSFLGSYSPRTDPLEFCLNQNLLDLKEWSPRTVAALLFHPAPPAVIPTRCGVKITRYETKEEDPEREHLSEQHTIEGPVYSQIHQTVKTITAMMSGIELWSTDGLKKLEYPPEAIWETIVNAIIHRDYSISDDIQVLVFNNRIEILSPGKLPGYVSIENILDARFSRNPKLVRTLNRYSDPPNKDLGEGLNTAFQKMKEFGLKAPEISEDGNYVKVMLPHAPLAAPTVAIMEFLRSHDTITNRQARDITGIKSENLVKVEFYKLRDEGHIERVPGLAGPKSAWRLTDAGRAFNNRK